MNKRILLLDDDELILESFQLIFTDLGFHVTTRSDSGEGVETALAEDFDLVVCDLRMPGLNGAEAIAKMLAVKPQLVVYLITAAPGDPIVQRALDAGAKGLMKKPFEVAKVLDLLRD